MATPARTAQDDRGDGRLGPPHHDQHAAAGARARQAAAPADARPVGRRHEAARSTACSPTRRRSASKRRWSSTSRSASGGSRASAATSSTSAARSPAVYRLIPERIRSLQELGLPAGHLEARRAAARPRAGDRPDRQRQVDDAGGDARQDQQRAARPHPHDRGPDRVHPPAQGLPGQPARGAQRHPAASARRCAPRCARTPTSCWSARCATSRRWSRRCASPRPAT